MTPLSLLPPTGVATSSIPTVGAVVRARARTYVVEDVASADPLFNNAYRVRMTSANFTEAAQHRNLEAGVLVRHPPLARQLAEHLERLQREGLLVACLGS